MDQSGVQNVIFIASSNARTLIRIHLIVERNIDLSSSWFSTILFIRLSLDREKEVKKLNKTYRMFEMEKKKIDNQTR